jgi:hypothetical protein
MNLFPQSELAHMVVCGTESFLPIWLVPHLSGVDDDAQRMISLYKVFPSALSPLYRCLAFSYKWLFWETESKQTNKQTWPRRGARCSRSGFTLLFPWQICDFTGFNFCPYSGTLFFSILNWPPFLAAKYLFSFRFWSHKEVELVGNQPSWRKEVLFSLNIYSIETLILFGFY